GGSRPVGIDSQPPLANLPRDDQALDLRGAPPDAVDPDVAVEPLDRVFPHIAPRAQDLEGLVDDPAGHFRAEKLEGAGPGMDQLAVGLAVDLPGDAVEHGFGSEDVH